MLQLWVALADFKRFPQLYVNGEFVGGLDIVKEMVENGEFDEIMKDGPAAETA